MEIEGTEPSRSVGRKIQGTNAQGNNMKTPPRNICALQRFQLADCLSISLASKSMLAFREGEMRVLINSLVVYLLAAATVMLLNVDLALASRIVGNG